MVIGVDGEAASVFSNNMAGRIVIRVEEGSSSNLLLQTLRAFDHTTRVGVSAVYIKDQNSTLSQCMGINTRLTGPPDFTKAVQAGTVQWVFDAARLIPVQGGLRQA